MIQSSEIMVFVLYVMLMNGSAFFTMGYDKRQAKASGPRVPEKRLFFLAVLGGSLGLYMGMNYYRHKTKHKTFTRGIPLIMVLQIVVVALILFGR
ncbi:DUF1294 domain-containing protein [Bacillus sp. FJAT-45037]|uniref:DUF1294 domain-containing protein n=1 Tax=Bacillus sp. FJAT-45037 TaxID=2011007 RepID=UPI001E35BD8E|nr:DUF1294 domain-containing protein [Bacillus sp. FJAT-45037]